MSGYIKRYKHGVYIYMVSHVVIMEGYDQKYGAIMVGYDPKYGVIQCNGRM